MSRFPLSVSQKIENSLREADVCQYIISDRSEELIETLRVMSVHSGMTIYVWTFGSGLKNIKSGEAPLPGTKGLLEALKYAQRNHYFAVYVFPAYTEENFNEIKMTLPSALMWLKTDKNTRLLFLVDEDSQLNFLFKHAEEVELSSKGMQRYKLRDSKWVPADD